MSKPNILFVFADQLRYSGLACNGNKIIKTPNFDRLASEGVVFDQAFSSCPICSPYRGQILTGNYSHINGVMCNEYRLFDNQTTIAHILKKEGYKTAFIGKWHLGYGPYGEHMRYGFDDMYAYNCMHNYYKVSYWHNEEGPFKMNETQITLDYIKDHVKRNSDKPFCAFLGWGPPHWGDSLSNRAYGEYPQEYNIYDPDKVDVPDNVPKEHREFAAKEIADYYGLITSLDVCMGRLLDELDKLGLKENTIVCFSSDHGDHLSAHGYGKPGDESRHYTLTASKATPHEEAVHIPFILRYPNKVKGNCRTQTMFNSVDVLPTLLGLCDISVPDDIQGKDLSHAVLGTSGEDPDSVYLQILGPGWPNRTKWVGLWRGVRTHDFTYARWKDRDGMRVLYDLKKDPLEMNNVIDDPDYAEVAEKMEKRLLKWIKETNDPFDTGKRLPDTEMLDIGQAIVPSKRQYNGPKEYLKAIEKNRFKFKAGEQVDVKD
jgi:arylsulfatase A-like enzyme